MPRKLRTHCRNPPSDTQKRQALVEAMTRPNVVFTRHRDRDACSTDTGIPVKTPNSFNPAAAVPMNKKRTSHEANAEPDKRSRNKRPRRPRATRQISIDTHTIAEGVPIAETNFDETQNLWAAVQAMANSRSKGRKKLKKPSMEEHVETYDDEEEEEEEEEEEDASTTTTNTIRTRSGAKLKPNNPRFRQHVLHRYGIDIDGTRKPHPTKPYRHFGTKPPDNGQRYSTLEEGLDKATIWLHDSGEQGIQKKIQSSITYMQQNNLGEPEYSALYLESLLRGEDRTVEPPQDRAWRCDRILQLSCPPRSDKLWDMPPLMEAEADNIAGRRTRGTTSGASSSTTLAPTASSSFSWDIQPDCAYWLSLAGFNPEYWGQIENAVFVPRTSFTCPYLTIEFKKDRWKNEEPAENQVAAFGSMALYNRFLLRKKALDSVPVTSKDNNDTIAADTDSLKHYGFTVHASAWRLWVIKPRNYVTWEGCTMSFVANFDVFRPGGVQTLAKWLDELHRWGLTVHARSCERDVKTYLQSEDVDISTVLGEDGVVSE